VETMTKNPTKKPAKKRAKAKERQRPERIATRATQVKNHIRMLQLIGYADKRLWERVIEDFAALDPPVQLMSSEVKNYAKHVNREQLKLDAASSEQFTTQCVAELILNIAQARSAGNLAEVRQAIKGLAELLGLEAARAVDLNLGDPTLDAMLNRYVERVKAGEELPGCDLSVPCD